MTLYPQLILGILATVRYPGTEKNLVELHMVDDDVQIDGNKVSFNIYFSKNPDPFSKSILKAAESAIHLHAGKDVEVSITPVFAEKKAPEVEKLLPQVKHVIAVSSGKGGVGKSTVAANLAVAMARQGYKVGLLDADIFGPSIPTMFQLEDYQLYGEMEGEKQWFIPAQQYGVTIKSIGFFIKPGTAAVWRGPMASSYLKQLIADTRWGALDYLILDTPPGTSDIHLTLLQNLHLSGAVIVSTPQKVALADARKGIDMYQNEKICVPILGLVENMAWFTPEELPDNRYYIFGRGGVSQLAREMHVPLLGQIPLVQGVRESGDEGTPVALRPESIEGRAFADLAQAVVKRIDEEKER